MTTDPPTAAAGIGSYLRLALVLAGAVAAVVAVALVITEMDRPGRQVETGIVVAVRATSLTSIQGFSIRTADGRTVDFRVGALENASSFPPGHLAEHKVTLIPVRVTYVEEAGEPVAVRLEDAP